nr:uncharacterized protein LOC129381685 [Dermacentor andersoni]
MVEASASLQYGARNPQTTRVHQSNTQYYPTAGTSTIQGYTHNRETVSTSFTLPVYSSSGGGKYAVASTSHAGTEEASGILGNDARIPDATGAEPWSMQYYAACGTTTVSDATDSGSTNYAPAVTTDRTDHARPSTSRPGIEKISSTTKDIASSSDAFWRYQSNTERKPITDQIYNLDGVYSSGSPSQQHLGPTSSINPTKPSTSRTGMLEASESLLYGARNPQSTRVHQRNTQYHPAEGTSTVYGFARPPCVTRGTRSTRRWPTRLATSTVPLTMTAQVASCWGPSGASIT